MLNPAELGYYERRPGSGTWYHREKSGSWEPRTCGTCGHPFMGKRRKGEGRFCKRKCADLARRTGDPSYRLLHTRIQRERGSAAQFPCVDACGRQAQDWSQIHDTDANELMNYQPRCRPCHMAYDGLHKQGEDHNAAKLTEARARGIKASAGATHKEIAEIHGVSRATVSMIRSGKTWTHI